MLDIKIQVRQDSPDLTDRVKDLEIYKKYFKSKENKTGSVLLK